MKKFSIGTKFNDRFLEEIAKINERYENTKIVEIFGSFAGTVISSGRPPWLIPKFDKKLLKKHIEYAHKLNIEFDYLLNTHSLLNVEYTNSGKKKILQFIDTLIECNVDRFTVTLPYLIELIKVNYKDIKITASTICGIDSMNKISFYKDLGVDRITLDYSLNREFRLLKQIVEDSDIEFELILNDTCILRCPVRDFHYNFFANLDSTYIYPDPYLAKCSLRKLKNLSLFIKSPWIRPEDVDEYKKLGISYFKIIGREAPQDRLIKLAETYTSGWFNGNLIELITFYLPRTKLKELTPYIDNKSLDGFINFFIKKEHLCYFGCYNCDYCDKIAQEVVIIDHKLKEEYIKVLEEFGEE